MTGFKQQCVSKYPELSKKTEKDSRTVATPSLDEHSIHDSGLEQRGYLADKAANIIMKILYCARCMRHDIL